jgi:predicted RNase H-like nuclease (RuvC/YqgF family)
LTRSSRNAAETKITALERSIKTLTVEIDELRQVKINLEGSIEKWKSENADWKKKYENEARLRVEEGDAMKKTFGVEMTRLTDACHNLEQKLKAAENAKVVSSLSLLLPSLSFPPGQAHLRG